MQYNYIYGNIYDENNNGALVRVRTDGSEFQNLTNVLKIADSISTGQ